MQALQLAFHSNLTRDIKMKKLLLCATAIFVSSVVNAQTQTGRQLDLIVDPSGNTTTVPSSFDPDALFEVQEVVGIFWDSRCANVEYTFNTAAGANLGTGIEISPEALADAVQDGLERWNDNRSSYIEMNVANLTNLGDRPRVGGDFINEVTFITPGGFGALASSPSTSLSADETFVAGDDLDGDGDSDVFDPEEAGLNVCTDIDGDGDIEFPAGFYRAGTIMDNDVQFSATVTWELEPTGGVALADVDAVSTHEFGHSHGLSHSTLNQISATDGTGSTMFPFIDTSDSGAEFGSRTPHIDDLAASAFIYQEGSDDVGELPQLQAGDVAFSSAFSVVSGTVVDGDGNDLTGASITLTTQNGKEAVGQSYSGRTVVFGDGAGGLFAFEESVVNSEYQVPVPISANYTLDIEALDGDPVPTTSVSTNAIIGGILGQNAFPEEGFAFNESDTEIRFASATPIHAGRRGRAGLDFITNEELIQRNAGDTDFIGTGAISGATEIVYAEMFDRDAVSQLIADGNVPVAALFETGTLDASLVPTFSEARLAIGRVNEDGTVEFTSTIRRINGDIIGQDNDGTRIPLVGAEGIPFQIRGEFNRDPEAQLFLVLEASDLVAGESGFPPAFVQVDVGTSGTSFLSVDGGPLSTIGLTFAVEVRYVNEGGPVSPFLLDF
jgi:hypothetical protein